MFVCMYLLLFLMEIHAKTTMTKTSNAATDNKTTTSILLKIERFFKQMFYYFLLHIFVVVVSAEILILACITDCYLTELRVASSCCLQYHQSHIAESQMIRKEEEE